MPVDLAAENSGLHLVVARSLDAIGPTVMKVRDFALAYMNEISAAEVELALAEVLTNSIKHGQAHAREGTNITVMAEAADGWLTVEVLDNVPVAPVGMFELITEDSLDFDPQDLESIPESGRGLALIVLTMDEVLLNVVADHFSLRMRKKLPTH